MRTTTFSGTSILFTDVGVGWYLISFSIYGCVITRRGLRKKKYSKSSERRRKWCFFFEGVEKKFLEKDMTDFDLCLSCSDGMNTLSRFSTFKHVSVFHGKSFKRFEIETGDRDHGSGCIAQLASCNKILLQMDKCRSVTARSEMGDAAG